MRKSAGREIAPEEISVFCEQIALMLGAGMALYDGVEALADNYHDAREYPMYRAISEHVIETGSLYEAIKQTGRFPRYMVEMTHVGERTGKLEQVMQGLATYYTAESRVKKSVSSAVAYPIVLGLMLTCVIALLLVRVLPIFDQVLGGMGANVGGASGMLMSFGMNVGKGVMIAVLLLIVAVLTAVIGLKTRYRRGVMRMVRKLCPPIDRLARRMSASRVAQVMSMMLGSGFPMEEALQVIPTILTDEDARDRLIQVEDAMNRGVSFPDALDQTGLFDKLHSRMIHMGYVAGQTDQVMTKIARIYEEDVDDGISGLISVIEPSLVAVLSVVIGSILLSVMLPMAGVISSMM
ncbi:MAG: type II secretion system F family protein [Clostridia bacterium]